ncbi:uncharacterized protein LOC118186162 [Stegodyphus dumicola]|uniref:uncharacterized protein LOC118186162 n=1 Tax=Stegodyphus dumicola TaxID=202533 RepID=UPI0015B2B224|nr:uncharacterized protein LOC118186162 [Stegodyphus dumicola]
MDDKVQTAHNQPGKSLKRKRGKEHKQRRNKKSKFSSASKSLVENSGGYLLNHKIKFFDLECQTLLALNLSPQFCFKFFANKAETYTKFTSAEQLKISMKFDAENVCLWSIGKIDQDWLSPGAAENSVKCLHHTVCKTIQEEVNATKEKQLFFYNQSRNLHIQFQTNLILNCFDCNLRFFNFALNSSAVLEGTHLDLKYLSQWNTIALTFDLSSIIDFKRYIMFFSLLPETSNNTEQNNFSQQVLNEESLFIALNCFVQLELRKKRATISKLNILYTVIKQRLSSNLSAENITENLLKNYQLICLYPNIHFNGLTLKLNLTVYFACLVPTLKQYMHFIGLISKFQNKVSLLLKLNTLLLMEKKMFFRSTSRNSFNTNFFPNFREDKKDLKDLRCKEDSKILKIFYKICKIKVKRKIPLNKVILLKYIRMNLLKKDNNMYRLYSKATHTLFSLRSLTTENQNASKHVIKAYHTVKYFTQFGRNYNQNFNQELYDNGKEMFAIICSNEPKYKDMAYFGRLKYQSCFNLKEGNRNITECCYGLISILYKKICNESMRLVLNGDFLTSKRDVKSVSAHNTNLCSKTIKLFRGKKNEEIQRKFTKTHSNEKIRNLVKASKEIAQKKQYKEKKEMRKLYQKNKKCNETIATFMENELIEISINDMKFFHKNKKHYRGIEMLNSNGKITQAEDQFPMKISTNIISKNLFERRENKLRCTSQMRNNLLQIEDKFTNEDTKTAEVQFTMNTSTKVTSKNLFKRREEDEFGCTSKLNNSLFLLKEKFLNENIKIAEDQLLTKTRTKVTLKNLFKRREEDILGCTLKLNNNLFELEEKLLNEDIKLGDIRFCSEYSINREEYHTGYGEFETHALNKCILPSINQKNVKCKTDDKGLSVKISNRILDQFLGNENQSSWMKFRQNFSKKLCTKKIFSARSECGVKEGIHKAVQGCVSDCNILYGETTSISNSKYIEITQLEEKVIHQLEDDKRQKGSLHKRKGTQTNSDSPLITTKLNSCDERRFPVQGKKILEDFKEPCTRKDAICQTEISMQTAEISNYIVIAAETFTTGTVLTLSQNIPERNAQNILPIKVSFQKSLPCTKSLQDKLIVNIKEVTPVPSDTSFASSDPLKSDCYRTGIPNSHINPTLTNYSQNFSLENCLNEGEDGEKMENERKMTCEKQQKRQEGEKKQKSKVRMGLSRKQKVKPLHPYLKNLPAI